MHKFDVVETAIKKPHEVRVIATDKTEKNAEAIVNIAVMRRGVETSFFKTCPAGQYSDGDPLGG